MADATPLFTEGLNILPSATKILDSLSSPLRVLHVVSHDWKLNSEVCDFLASDEPNSLLASEGVWLRIRTEKEESEDGTETETNYLVIQQNIGEELSDEATNSFVVCSLLASHTVYLVQGELTNEVMERIVQLAESCLEVEADKKSGTDLKGCFNLLTAVYSSHELFEGVTTLGVMSGEGEFNSDLGMIPDIYGKHQGYNCPDLSGEALVDFLTFATRDKSICGRHVCGPILSSLVQHYSYKLGKESRIYVKQAFEKSVANGARSLKEKLLETFREQIESYEESMPLESDEINKDFFRFLGKANDEYVTLFANLMDMDRVQEERNDLNQRLELMVKDLLDANTKSSLDYCKASFVKAFSDFNDEHAENMSVERLDMLLKDSIDNYLRASKGPCADQTFIDNFEFIQAFIVKAFEFNEELHEEKEVALQRQVTQMQLQLNEANEYCKSKSSELELVHTERSSILTSQDSLKDEVSELKALVFQAEEEVAKAQRSIASLNRELDLTKTEAGVTQENLKNFYEAKTSELEQKLKQYEQQIQAQQTENQLANERLQKELAFKTKQLDLLKAKPSGGFYDTEASLLANLQDYLDEILASFAVDYSARAKSVTLMEQLTRIQEELDNSLVGKTTERQKAYEDLQLQVVKLKNELESQQENYAKTLDKTNSELAEALSSVSHDIERRSKRIVDLEERVINYERANEQLYTTHSNLSSQIESQYQVIDAYKKKIESQTQQIDDLNLQINSLKYEIVGRDDDADSLLELLGASLDIKTRKLKLSLKPYLSRVHTPKIKQKCEQILGSFGLSFS